MAALVAAPGAVSSEQTVLKFPMPKRGQIHEIINMSGRGFAMSLAEFCELNKESIPKLVTNCSLETWIEKGQEIAIRL
jgi:hypothetical protein